MEGAGSVVRSRRESWFFVVWRFGLMEVCLEDGLSISREEIPSLSLDGLKRWTV